MVQQEKEKMIKKVRFFFRCLLLQTYTNNTYTTNTDLHWVWVNASHCTAETHCNKRRPARLGRQRRGRRRARRRTRWRGRRESFVTLLTRFARLCLRCRCIPLRLVLCCFSVLRGNADDECAVSAKPAFVMRTVESAISAWTRPDTVVRTSWGRNAGSASVRSGLAFR